jgi:hypothetical protein
MEHMSTLEPTSEAGRGPGLRDACLCRSPLVSEVGSGTEGRVAVPKPS